MLGVVRLSKVWHSRSLIADGGFLADQGPTRCDPIGTQANSDTIWPPWSDANRILLPPLHEQRRIAEVLDSIDEAIERAETVITSTEQLRDALLHDLLTKGVPGWHTEWKDAPNIGQVPACWEVARLGDVAEVESGGQASTPSTTPQSIIVPMAAVDETAVLGERRKPSTVRMPTSQRATHTLRTPIRAVRQDYPLPPERQTHPDKWITRGLWLPQSFTYCGQET